MGKNLSNILAFLDRVLFQNIYILGFFIYIFEFRASEYDNILIVLISALLTKLEKYLCINAIVIFSLAHNSKHYYLVPHLVFLNYSSVEVGSWDMIF